MSIRHHVATIIPAIRTAQQSARFAWAIAIACTLAFLIGCFFTLLNFDNRSAVVVVDPFVGASGLVYGIVGALIVARHHHHGLGRLFLLFGALATLALLMTQLAIYGLLTRPGSVPGADWLLWGGFWLSVVPFTLQPTLMLLLFPSGRLIGTGTRLLAGLSLLLTTLLVVSLITSGVMPPKSGTLYDQTPSPTQLSTSGMLDPGSVIMPLVLCSLASLVILFRRTRRARGIERQQFKWILYAMALVVAANAADFILRSENDRLVVVTGPALSISSALVPVAVGIAILRFHLFDIDRVISRTLSYAVVTTGLAGAYLGLVLLLQLLLDPLASDSALAVAGSTLLVAALARPLRNRVQGRVDRRFYRRHYDATAEIDRFAARLRNQTDLTALVEEIRGVVQETMQPSHVSLWVPPDVPASPRN